MMESPAFTLSPKGIRPSGVLVSTEMILSKEFELWMLAWIIVVRAFETSEILCWHLVWRRNSFPQNHLNLSFSPLVSKGDVSLQTYLKVLLGSIWTSAFLLWFFLLLAVSLKGYLKVFLGSIWTFVFLFWLFC